MNKKKSVVNVSYMVKSNDGFLTDKKKKFYSFDKAMTFIRSPYNEKGETFFGKPVIS